MKSNLSAIVLTKNEEGNIADCLKSLSFCDEILVIDDNSTDKTTDIAKKLGAKVINRKLNNDFAGQRNFALKRAKNEWVLFIDADERVTEKLADEIRSVIKNNSHTGYYLKRKDMLWGRKINHGEMGNIKLLRLAKKNAGKWERKVHEKWIVKENLSKLKNSLIHKSHQNISEFIKHVDYFSSLHSESNFKEGKRSGVFKICTMPVGHFLNNFVFKLGFIDGIEGFVIAFTMSFHSFLAWSKLYLMQKKNNL